SAALPVLRLVIVGIVTRIRPRWIPRHEHTRKLKPRIIVESIPVAAPLPDVTRHVVKSVTVRWKLGNRREACETVIARILYRKLALVRVRHPFTRGSQLIPP